MLQNSGPITNMLGGTWPGHTFVFLCSACESLFSLRRMEPARSLKLIQFLMLPMLEVDGGFYEDASQDAD